MDAHFSKQKRDRPKSPQPLQSYCLRNVNTFLEESSLHGLKFVANGTITIWERLFFLCSFVAAFVITANLISNIYAKWDSTPVIIGISPHPTSILKIPFPAITVCNMNQVLRSKVSKYEDDSQEGAVLKLLCLMEAEFNDSMRNLENFRDNDLKIPQFIVEHAQSCAKLILFCRMSSFIENCTDLFREVMTDEGLCCVFNVLNPKLLYKGNYSLIKEYIRSDGRVPVAWSPEAGYASSLPERYYPRTAVGTGVSMGLTLVLNAELEEYYCSTANGPGFKVKEIGLTVPIGHETRFRIDASRSEAVSSLRAIHRNSRQCLFNNEEKLIYYKYYSRSNCEKECQAKFFYERCLCIPYKLPLVLSNSKVCSAQDIFCVSRTEKELARGSQSDCRSRCLPSCFDLSFMPATFSVPLAERNFTVPNSIIRDMDKVYARENIAVVHFYYRESVFYGNLKNVYIGLTEFLSNTGGILGLFLGFSFISVAEIIYFSFLRPFFEIVLPNLKAKHRGNREDADAEMDARIPRKLLLRRIAPTQHESTKHDMTANMLRVKRVPRKLWI